MNNHGTHCYLKFSKAIYPKYNATHGKLHNTNHPSDITLSYPQIEVYHPNLNLGLVPQNILSNSSPSHFHLTIKHISLLKCLL